MGVVKDSHVDRPPPLVAGIIANAVGHLEVPCVDKIDNEHEHIQDLSYAERLNESKPIGGGLRHLALM